MQFIVLGKYGPYPAKDGDVTGFLLTSDEAVILLDLGNGSLKNYFKHKNINDLDAVILSHLHDDHTGDIPSLKYALLYNGIKTDMYAPDEPREEFSRIAAINTFNLKTITQDSVIMIKDMRISFCEVAHPVKTFAVKVEAGGKTFVCSGDTYYVKQLEAFCKNADFVLCEAGILDYETDKKDKHMSIKEGCEMAKRANVKKIVFAHLFAKHSLDKYQKEREIYPEVNSEIVVENKIYII